MLPLSGGDFTLSFQIEGRPPAATPGSEPVAGARIVSASYASTMGMRIVQGRDLSPLDTEHAPGAVLVNETMARRYWPSGSPLGAKVLINDLDATIVGIVGDVHHRGPARNPGAEMYIPFQQFGARQAVVVLRTAGDPARATAALRAAVKEIDPSLPLANVVTMQSAAGAERVAAALPGGAADRVLAARGGPGAGRRVWPAVVLGEPPRARARRPHGARRGTRARAASRAGQSAALVAIGLVLGVACRHRALAPAHDAAVRGEPGDPATIVAMACAIAAAAMLASLPPALRASRIDPVVALREE